MIPDGRRGSRSKPFRGKIAEGKNACVCQPSGMAADRLADLLRDAVAAGLGVPFRPQEIVFVDDLPRTRNQKIMRRVLRALYVGEDPGRRGSGRSPAAR